MSQKNTLFNYFQRAKPSPSSSSGSQNASSSGDKNTASFGINKTPTNGEKKSSKLQRSKLQTPKLQTPTGKATSNSVTPKRPLPKEAKSGGTEKGRSGGAKSYKRLRLISDDEDSENDQSLANGKASADGDVAAKTAAPDPVHSESDGPPDDDSEDDYKREYACNHCRWAG